MIAMLTKLMTGAFFYTTLLLWNIHPAAAENADKTVLLRRDWPSGQEYKIRCVYDSNSAMVGKGGANIGGGLGSKVTNEFNLVVWPVPAGGRMFGLQWTAMATETRYPGGSSSFDSRKPAQTQRADAVWGWDMIGNAWRYYDENGDSTGKTGLGHAHGFWKASPFPTFSPRSKGPLFYRICALDSLTDKPVPIGHRWSATVHGDHHTVGAVETGVDFVMLRSVTVDGRECAVVGFRSDLKNARKLEPVEVPVPPDDEVMIDEASIEGEIQVEISSGLIVRSTGRSVVVSRKKGVPLTSRTTDAMEMTLLSIAPIHPETPLPPPLQKPDANSPAPNDPTRTMPPEARTARPGEVVLRVEIKPNTRTLLTHSLSQAIRLDLAGKRQDAMHLKMVDEIEDMVRSGGNPGETLHESRWLARRTEAPGAAGLSYDSHKLEAGDVKVDPSAVEDWTNVRKMKVFLLRGPDGKPLRSWADGKEAQSPKSPLAARMMGNHLEVKVFEPEYFPKEPIVPGASWPLSMTMDSVDVADEVAVTGEYTLQSVETVDGRRIAVVGFTGIMAPADSAAPPKPGSGVIENGRIEGTYSIDLDNQRWVHRRIRKQHTSRIQVPGGRQGFRQEIDAEIEQTFHSEDPLPPMP